MTHISAVSRQWASRPASQRFVNLDTMADQAIADRRNSSGKVVSTRSFQFKAVGDDHQSLIIQGPQSEHQITNYSFGQLSALAKAPAGYLRTLPSELVADNLNYGMRFNRDAEDVGVLLTRKLGVVNPDGSIKPVLGEDLAGGQTAQYIELRAATGPNYGRVWNSDVIDAVRKTFGNGTRETGSRWQVPGEFRKQVPITVQNTTFYYGDRSMMIYLADEQNDIEIPNRRGGTYGQLARGVIFWNSEVGEETLGMSMFLYDYTCMNRNIWGVRDLQEIRIRHTASAPDKWIEQMEPIATKLANSSTEGIREVVVAAQAAKIDEDLDAFFKRRQFTKPQINAIKAAHMAEEDRPIETLWDASVATSAYARDLKWEEDKMAMERKGGEFLSLAERWAA
jgi:hypothetical protein